MRHEAGVTLIEIIVALTIMGLLSGMTTLAMTGLRRPASGAAEQIASAQRTAVLGGSSLRLLIEGDTVLFLSDGRAIGRMIDPLRGTLRAATR